MFNTSELSMQFKSSIAIGLSSQFDSVERSKVNAFPINADLCNPFSGSLVEVNALISTLIISSWALIVLLLCPASNTQISINIVESIAVFVITFSWVTVRKPQYAPMHVLHAISIFCGGVAYCIKLSHTHVVEGVPAKLLILGIKMGAYSCEQATTQWDFTVGCVRGCHSLSNQRLGFGGTTNPDTLIVSKEAQPRFALQEQKS